MHAFLIRLCLRLGSPRLTRWLAERLGVTADERAAWARAEAARRGLASLADLRCPLCGSEIRRAWTVTPDGRLNARRGSLCPTCDFRLDSCRHCRHFLPGSGQRGEFLAPAFGETDYTTGRCNIYRGYVSVYDLYGGAMADRFANMGVEMVRAPRPILDSYVPLPECTAFSLAPARLRHSGVRLDRAWRGWLRWVARGKVEG